MFEAGNNPVADDTLQNVQSYFKDGIALDKMLEQEEAQLVERLKSVRAARDKLKLLNGATAVGAAGPDEESPLPDPFEGLIAMVKASRPTTDLVKEVLNINQQPMTAKLILEALKEFGWQGEPELLYSSLYRMNKRSELVASGTRGSQEYGLPSWQKGRFK